MGAIPRTCVALANAINTPGIVLTADTLTAPRVKTTCFTFLLLVLILELVPECLQCIEWVSKYTNPDNNLVRF